jgi:diguanylate cyclase (GGDEF)-like protein
MDRRMAALVDSWARLACRAGFIPGGPAMIRPVIKEALRRLVIALTAETFDPVLGYRIGFDLVSSRISSPRALGDTMTFLGQQLIPGLDIEHPQALVRLNALLGQLAVGFAEAMSNVVRAGADSINRAERAAWRERCKVLDRQLQQALLFERLTGLPNRAQLTTRLEGILAEALTDARLGLCLINMDWFRMVNNSLGRDVGDKFLQIVALRLSRVADRYGYFLAHLGGDEFAIAVDGAGDIDDLAKAAEFALDALREPFRLDGHSLSISASAGIVERAAIGAHPVELIRAAEIALSWAKTERRGNWIAFDPDRYEGELRERTLTAALERGEFTLEHFLKQLTVRVQPPASTAGHEFASGDLEVKVYTSNNNGEPLRDAVVELLNIYGFDVIAQAPIEYGSWFQRLTIRGHEARALEKLGELAGKMERAAEVKHIQAPRSEGDEREANAIARLIEVTQCLDEVVIQMSSIIFIKTGGYVIARVLTEAEIRILNENPHLLRDPAELMDALKGLVQSDRSTAAAIDSPT